MVDLGLFCIVVLFALIVSIGSLLLSRHLLLLFILVPDIVKHLQVMEEIVFVPVLSEHLEDAYHLVVSVVDQLVEKRHRRVMDHAQHRVLPQDLVLELHDSVDVNVQVLLITWKVLVIRIDLLILSLFLLRHLRGDLELPLLLFGVLIRSWLAEKLQELGRLVLLLVEVVIRSRHVLVSLQRVV